MGMENPNDTFATKDATSIIHRFVYNWLITDPQLHLSDRHNYQAQQHEDMPTLYFFGGRLRSNKAKPIVLLSGVLICLPAILFWVYSASWCWHQISPAVVIIFSYVWLLTIVFFIKASTSDPGVLPRNIHIPVRVDAQTRNLKEKAPEEYFNTVFLPYFDAKKAEKQHKTRETISHSELGIPMQSRDDVNIIESKEMSNPLGNNMNTGPSGSEQLSKVCIGVDSQLAESDRIAAGQYNSSKATSLTVPPSVKSDFAHKSSSNDTTTVDTCKETDSQPSSVAPGVLIKYCATCHVWRSARDSHCNICNSCVLNHDHHCIFLNNCVGMRNYQYFLWFLTFATLTATLLSVISFVEVFHYLYQPVPEIPDFHKSISKYPVAFFLALYSLACLIYPLLLCGFHLYLTSHNLTTREYINHAYGKKRSKRDWINVYDTKNICKNLYINWFGKARGCSLVRMWDRYEDGDLRMQRVQPLQAFHK